MADEMLLRIVIADDTPVSAGAQSGGQGGGGSGGSGGAGDGGRQVTPPRSGQKPSKDRDDDDDDDDDGRGGRGRKRNDAAFQMSALRSIGGSLGMGSYLGRGLTALDLWHGGRGSFARSMSGSNDIAANVAQEKAAVGGFSGVAAGKPSPTIENNLWAVNRRGQSIDPSTGKLATAWHNPQPVLNRPNTAVMNYGTGQPPMALPAGGAAGGGAMSGLMAAAGPIAAAVLIATMVRDGIESGGKGIAGGIGIGTGIAGNDFRQAADGFGEAAGKAAYVFGMAGAGVAKAFGHISDASQDLVDTFIGRGKELARYSPDLAVATAISTVRRTMADFEEAGKMGPVLANLQKAYDDVYLLLREALLPIKKVLAETLTGILEAIAYWLPTGIEVVRRIWKFFEAIGPTGINRLISWALRKIGEIDADKNRLDLWDRVWEGHANSEAGRTPDLWLAAAAQLNKPAE